MDQKARGTSCCGREHWSDYCPDCGRCLEQPNPLDALLDHCEKTARDLQKRWPRSTHPERSRLAVGKWSAWSKALRDVLEKGDAES